MLKPVWVRLIALGALALVITADDSRGRGFGGGGMRGGAGAMGGGIRGGGGFPGGMGGMGGFPSGMHAAGGFPSGMHAAGGFRSGMHAGAIPGGFGAGGRAGAFPGAGGGGAAALAGRGGPAGNFGAAGRGPTGRPSAGDLGNFLGLPSDMGMGASGNFNMHAGSYTGPRGGTAAGAAVTGPRGNTAGAGAAVGPRGNVAAAGRGVMGADGAVAGRGAVAARGPLGGYGYVASSARYAQAAAVRGGFYAWDMFTPAWYAANPYAWNPYARTAAQLTSTAWTVANWGTLGPWLACTGQPLYYNYGQNVVYQDNAVAVNGQPQGTPEEYYQQASQLAATGAPAAGDATDAASDPAAASAGDDQQEWLPLGVFAMTRGDQKDSHLTIQLAVNKAGVIRGNYTDTVTHNTLPVQGSVNKETQRVAWTIGKNTKNVIETGVYNLTQDECVALAHFGPDRTEQWLLVRLQPPADAAAGATPPTDVGTDPGAGSR